MDSTHGLTPGQSSDGVPQPGETDAIRGRIEGQLALVGMTPETQGAEAYEALVAGAVRQETSQPRGTLRSLADELSGMQAQRAARIDELQAAGMPIYTVGTEPPPCPDCDGARFVRNAGVPLGGRVAAPTIESEAQAIATVAAAQARIMPCPRCTRDAPEHLLTHAGIPPRQMGWSFTSFEHAPGKVEALADTQVWCRDVAAGSHESLMLVGGPGTGKSHLATAAVISLCARGVKARFVYVPDMLDALRPGGARDTTAEWAYLRAVPVLVMDDIAADQVKEWAEGRLTALIHDRLHEGRPTVITTDLSADQLGDALGARVASRLREYRTVVVRGADMRGR